MRQWAALKIRERCDEEDASCKLIHCDVSACEGLRERQPHWQTHLLKAQALAFQAQTVADVLVKRSKEVRHTLMSTIR
eukprot:1153509-Pelagomonas_calceolata.AAC.9